MARELQKETNKEYKKKNRTWRANARTADGQRKIENTRRKKDGYGNRKGDDQEKRN